MKKSLRFIAVAAVLGFLLNACWEKSGVNESDASWMPKGATDGAYHHSFTVGVFGPPAYFYEYTISEEDFVAYLESLGKDPREIEEPVYVTRYLSRFEQRDDYRVDGDLDWEQYEAAIGITISDGLVWDYSFEDQGSVYAFDRSLSRAFIEIWTR